MSGHEESVPDGWTKRTLGDVAQLVKTKVNPEDCPDAHYVGLEHIEANTMRLLGHGVGADVKSAKIKFRTGDVLYGKLRPYLNKVGRVPFDGISSTDFLVFTESAELDAGYLAQFLNQLSVAEYAHHVSAGVELPRVDWKSLASLPITFPVSKATQRAVVTEIESARALGAGAAGHLEDARKAIDRFRRAVLVAACSGRLTTDWREDHPNDSAHLDYASKADQTNKVRRGVDPTRRARDYSDQIPVSWLCATVAQLLARGFFDDVKDGNHGAVHPKVSEFTDSGLPFVAANLVRDGRVDYASAPRVSGDVLGRLRVGFSHPGDVILTHKGTVGRVAIATEEAVLTPQTTYYRCHGIEPRYLALFFQSLLFYTQLAQGMAQTTRDFVPITQQYLLTIILPPHREQLEIVSRVDQLMRLADKVSSSVNAASRRLQWTSQSILAKALSGELSTF